MKDKKSEVNEMTVNVWHESQICIGCNHAVFIPEGYDSSSYACEKNYEANSSCCKKNSVEATEEEWSAKF